MEMLFLGDISFNNNIIDNLKKYSNMPFERLKDTQKYDVVFANFESPISSKYEPVRKKITLKTVDEASQELKNINKNMVVSLANNHILDYGIQGYEETVVSLTKKDIAYFGVKEYKDYILDRDKLAIVAECFDETTPLCEYDGKKILYREDIDRICENIKIYREKNYKVIVYIHWGTEFCRYPSKRQRDVAKRLIDSGAEAIIGHHPHIVQNYEKYKDKYIFYSLGNFLFSDVISYNKEKTFYNKLLRSNRRSVAVVIKVENGMIKFVRLKYYKITKLGQVLSNKNILDRLSIVYFNIGSKIPFVVAINHKINIWVNYYHILISKIKFGDLKLEDLTRKIFGKRS